MKHEFDDSTIINANEQAVKNLSYAPNRITTTYLRAFLNHLPTPESDDWQQCSWGDILHTDERVKAEYISGTIIEGVPDGISDNGVYLVDGNLIPYSTDAKWYRIPAPVQHPDPEVHAVIIVSGAYDIDWDHAYAYVSDGTGYNIVEPLNSDSRLLPESIHNWSPAKVVATDEPVRPEDVGF